MSSLPAATGTGLRESARNALIWGAGFNASRDLVQLGTMLVLVRILSPVDYGRYSLSQTVLLLISAFSAKSFYPHALQMRDPRDVNWHLQFTAAIVLNSAALLLCIVVAGFLFVSPTYRGAALPLVATSLVFLVEIPGSLRYTMVQAHHEWARFRILAMVGSLLAMGAGIVIALCGGGYWALVVQVVLFPLPGALDLFLVQRWVPNLSWSGMGYLEIWRFGLKRAGSQVLQTSRQLIEQFLITGVFSFAILGIFTRSVGLSTLCAGRIGSIVLMSLYPVITRAESGSEQFRRLAGLTLRGVTWSTIVAATLLTLEAPIIVRLLYGSHWMTVIPLIPAAAAQIAASGIALAAYYLLLANNEPRMCLLIDLGSAASGIAVALLLVPLGPLVYLEGLSMQSVAVLAFTFIWLIRSGGISTSNALQATVPPVVSSVGAAAFLFTLRTLLEFSSIPLWYSITEGAVFLVLVAGLLRAIFRKSLQELLEIAPLGSTIGRLVRIPT